MPVAIKGILDSCRLACGECHRVPGCAEMNGQTGELPVFALDTRLQEDTWLMGTSPCAACCFPMIRITPGLSWCRDARV